MVNLTSVVNRECFLYKLEPTGRTTTNIYYHRAQKYVYVVNSNKKQNKKKSNLKLKQKKIKNCYQNRVVQESHHLPAEMGCVHLKL